ncbi:hypothetical protein, partial [Acinetobacter pittii]|uniref:hypothetical protein n=1 Tax=Acinetobacter pittii TaxID=48296 RepID=UPI001BB46C96
MKSSLYETIELELLLIFSSVSHPESIKTPKKAKQKNFNTLINLNICIHLIITKNKNIYRTFFIQKTVDLVNKQS